MSLVDEVIEAHGGLDRWRQTSAVRLRVSSGGLAFATRDNAPRFTTTGSVALGVEKGENSWPDPAALEAVLQVLARIRSGNRTAGIWPEFTMA